MSKCYFVANYTVTNEEGYAPYLPQVAEMVADVPGAFGRAEVLEGNPEALTVVLEFESRDHFDSWYRSPEYQRILPLRLDNSAGWAVLLGADD